MSPPNGVDQSEVPEPVPVLPGAEPYSHDGGPVGVLLVHGFTGTPQSMRPWAEHLSAEGFTVRLPRLPGHGTRWQDMNLTRWQDWYGEASRALDELVARCDSVFVMGLSMGGTLTLRLAQERSADIAGIVLVNASVMTLNKQAKLLPVLSKAVASVKGVGDDIKKPGAKELAYTRTPLKAAASLAQLWTLVTDGLGRITCPVLLFRSREDHVVEPANAALILAQLGSSDVQERVLEESYHVATLDNDAPAIFEGSVEFVRRLTSVST
jgi:carboxylesterase